jgi:hypothetical protein
MLKYKFIKYGVDKYSLLVGIIHNNPKSKEFISKILNQRRNEFDFYLIEMNFENFQFIKQNKIKFSEFYEFSKLEIPKEKLIFIDMSFQRELKEYQILIRRKEKNPSYKIFDDLISFKLEKFLYYKIKNINNQLRAEEFSSIKDFHKIHIKLREHTMEQEIKRYWNKNNLVVIGLNHFDEIHKFMTTYNPY